MDIEEVGADLADSRVDEIEGDGHFRALRALSVGHALGARVPRLRPSRFKNNHFTEMMLWMSNGSSVKRDFRHTPRIGVLWLPRRAHIQGS